MAKQTGYWISRFGWGVVIVMAIGGVLASAPAVLPTPAMPTITARAADGSFTDSQGYNYTKEGIRITCKTDWRVCPTTLDAGETWNARDACRAAVAKDRNLNRYGKVELPWFSFGWTDAVRGHTDEYAVAWATLMENDARVPNANGIPVLTKLKCVYNIPRDTAGIEVVGD
jgi:hypothetical protein